MPGTLGFGLAFMFDQVRDVLRETAVPHVAPQTGLLRFQHVCVDTERGHRFRRCVSSGRFKVG